MTPIYLGSEIDLGLGVTMVSSGTTIIQPTPVWMSSTVKLIIFQWLLIQLKYSLTTQVSDGVVNPKRKRQCLNLINLGKARQECSCTAAVETDIDHILEEIRAGY